MPKRPTEIVPATPVSEIVPATERLSDRAKRYADASRSKSTVKGYAEDWAGFCEWCKPRKHVPLPASPTAVAEHLIDFAEGKDARRSKPSKPRSVSSVNRRRCAIAKYHWLAGLAIKDPSARPDDPTSHPLVQVVWEGIQRVHGAPPRRKRAIAASELADAIDATPDTLVGARDRALLLVGFRGAFRRSELVGIDVEHVVFAALGLVVTLPRSKTDQAGSGREVVVADLPTEDRSDTHRSVSAAVKCWMDSADITDGPLFRPVFGGGRVVVPERLSARSVALRVKACLKAAGVAPDRATLDAYSAHSLRAGFVTEARRAGASPESIMEVTGHKSFDMLRRYIREADRWNDPAGARIELPPRDRE